MPGGRPLWGVKLGDVGRLRREFAGVLGDVFESFPRWDQRRWGACYLRGLMINGRRKSMGPMAERMPAGNMQAPQQFGNQSPWDPSPVRQRIAQRIAGDGPRRSAQEPGALTSNGEWPRRPRALTTSAVPQP
ncbi:transposase [Streptomyces sp. NPDC060322]|uniref:transposase n=1 Tax=Streptomyces sp. NPDC060322 TaxID=3347097 RepID=UPI0036648CDA